MHNTLRMPPAMAAGPASSPLEMSNIAILIVLGNRCSQTAGHAESVWFTADSEIKRIELLTIWCIYESGYACRSSVWGPLQRSGSNPAFAVFGGHN